jgi:transposase
VRLRDGGTSAPSLAASARISRTLSAWPNHRSKSNVPNQCLFPPPPQVIGRWHDGPAWPKSALGQRARHFGLLRA